MKTARNIIRYMDTMDKYYTEKTESKTTLKKITTYYQNDIMQTFLTLQYQDGKEQSYFNVTSISISEYEDDPLVIDIKIRTINGTILELFDDDFMLKEIKITPTGETEFPQQQYILNLNVPQDHLSLIGDMGRYILIKENNSFKLLLSRE